MEANRGKSINMYLLPIHPLVNWLYLDQKKTMKGLSVILLPLILFIATHISCRPGSRKGGDSDTIVARTYQTYAYSDSASRVFARSILTLMKAKDYKGLAEHIHPDEGILFAPYGFIDTAGNRRFSRASFLALVSDSSGKPLDWGRYDGSGLPIELTWPDYASKFVYNADFLNAPDFSVNSLKSRGNSVNNIDQVFSGHQYTESYFPGFDEKYAGLDWASLRLVFKQKEGELYLVGVVHDQWTS